MHAGAATAKRVILLNKRAKPFYARHPWVYAGAIDAVEGDPADGDPVELISGGGHFIAHGLFNSQSKIRVRLYSWDPDQPIDEALLADRVDAAIRLRVNLGLMVPGQACRLIFSEADGLSGLVVDRYDRWLTMQFTALGLAQRRELLAELLAERLQPAGIVLRTERGIGALEGLQIVDGPLRGSLPTEPVVIEENGLRFQVNLAEGQKTGFYLDQRDNRQAVARLARGRRVLDAFCYTGGFGLHAAAAGAAQVLGVDLSAPALELARSNAQLNGLEQLEYVRAAVFAYLDELAGAGAQFDLVVLDPPKFARDRRALDEALRGYRRLQALGLRLLAPEGFLVVCCCSGLITLDMLEELLAQVAADARRDVRILERRGPAPDHPVALSCRESHYLKCLITHVR